MMHCMGCSALSVGILLLLSSVFFVTGSAYDVPVGLDVLLLSTYLMLSISLIFAGAGLHWKHNDDIHQVCRQGAKASFLMGLTAGIFSEMLCNNSDGKRSADLRWSCGLLGASSGLILFGLLTLRSNANSSVLLYESDDMLSEDSESDREEAAEALPAGANNYSGRTMFSPLLNTRPTFMTL